MLVILLRLVAPTLLVIIKPLVTFCCLMMALTKPVLASEAPADLAEHSTSGHHWTLKLPKTNTVAFSGALDFEGANVGTPSMLYPAPNAAAFLVSVVTHGLIVESQKDSQRKKAQEQADRVLEPYRSILDAMTYPQLAQPWLEDSFPESRKKLLADDVSPEAGDWSMESVPVLLMAQNQKALILDNLISVRAPNASEDAVQHLHIRVISPTVEGQDPASSWMADQGSKLKKMSVWLFSESMRIAMDKAIPDASNDQPFRTIRYMSAGAEKMERAQLISQSCDRLLIRTLRGSLMSVPARPLPSNGVTGPESSCLKG